MLVVLEDEPALAVEAGADLAVVRLALGIGADAPVEGDARWESALPALLPGDDDAKVAQVVVCRVKIAVGVLGAVL